MRKTTLFTIALLLVFLGVAQTPVQSYFEWTEMPFTKAELEQRRKKFIDTALNEGKIGLVIIPARDGFSDGETFRQLDDFYYFTGLELPNSLLVFDLKEKSAVIYTPEDDLRFASTSRPNDFPGRPLLNDAAISKNSGITLMNINEFSTLMNKNALTKTTVYLNKGRPGAFDFKTLEYIASPYPEQILATALESKHNGLQFDNCFTAIAKVRMIKSEAEIKLMRSATEINVTAIKTAAKSIKNGVDERYLEGVLEGSYKINGAHRLAFGSIIKSGPNSLWPWRILATHYDRRNRNMIDGDLVIFDVGCEYKNYVSDVGRTFPVSGKFTETQKK